MRHSLLAGAWLTAALAAPLACAQPAFPGAEGFGAIASGGRGGAVLYVTTLDPDPNGVVPGSLNHALRQSGPRTVLFKVSGVIHAAANVVNGDVTIAGQTSPGGVVVRGLICDGHYERNVCGNVIVRHLRTRPGWNLPVPPGGERLDDGVRIDGMSRFILDHVSIANATDEAVQLSWASDGTIQYSTLAETVGDHAAFGGMLMNYSHPTLPQDRLSVHHNVWFRIGGRLPEITCEASAFPGDTDSIADCQAHALRFELSNNLVFDPEFPTFYNRDVDQNAANGPYRLDLNLVGNRWLVPPDFPYGMLVHDFLDVAASSLYASDNGMSLYPAFADYQLFYCCNDFPANAPNTDLGVATRLALRHPFPAIAYDASAALATTLPDAAGALPHDPQDRRIAATIASATYSPLPNSVPLADDAFDFDFPSGSPPPAPLDTDGDGMPDAFELANGLNPNAFDANGTELSVAFTGVAGYTNLECYLNALADSLAGAGVLFRDGFE